VAEFESHQGSLLIASPSLLDPNFHRTVVLVAEHTESGAMGVVLNRPSGVTVAEAVPNLTSLVDGDELLHIGGPVQQEAVVVLAELDDPTQAALLALGDIGFLKADVDPDDLSGSLRRARVYLGYAGWGAAQLEAELGESAWIVEPAQPEDLFVTEASELWSAVLRRKGGTYAVIATMPPDPSVN
jgi:putative transcriptional regulator